VATNIDKFTIDFTLDNNKLKQSVNQASNTIKNFADDIQKTFKSALGGIASALGVDFLNKLVNNFTQIASQLGFTAQTLGENVTTLNAWQQAVIRSGGSAEQFNATLGSLRDKLQQAQYLGNAGLAGYFNYLGISARDSTGKVKSATMLLLDISSKLQGRSLNQQQFLGHQLGIDDATLRILMKGKKATEELLKSVSQYGLLTKQDTDNAIKYRNSLANLNQVYQNIKYTLAEALLPYLNKFVDFFTGFTNTIRQHKEVIIGAFTALATILGVLALTNPWTYIIAGIISLIAWVGELYDDYEHFVKYGRKHSLIDWSWVQGFVSDLKTVFNWVGKIADNFGITKGKAILVGSALLALIPIFSLLKTAVSLFGVALDVSLVPLGLILATTGLILANWKAIKSEAKDVISGIKNSKGVGDVFQAVIDKPLLDLGSAIGRNIILPLLSSLPGKVITPAQRAQYQALLTNPDVNDVVNPSLYGLFTKVSNQSKGLPIHQLSHIYAPQSSSQTTNIHANNINLPGIANSQQFIKQFQSTNSPSNLAWQNSSGRII
jgi:hypothetical protein